MNSLNTRKYAKTNTPFTAVAAPVGPGATTSVTPPYQRTTSFGHGSVIAGARGALPGPPPAAPGKLVLVLMLPTIFPPGNDDDGRRARERAFADGSTTVDSSGFGGGEVGDNDESDDHGIPG